MRYRVHLRRQAWWVAFALTLVSITSSSGFSRTAHADVLSASAGDDERTDRARLLHTGITAALGAAYLTIEFGLNRQLSPEQCHWCAPTRFDVAARDALRWRDTSAADTLSNWTGYVLAPVAATGLTMLGSEGRGWRRRFDDVVPVIQSAIVVSLLQHVAKLSAARQRPYAHYATPGELGPSVENDVSFWSGHTSLAFSLAVSSGVVVSTRGYRLAPVVWATGLTLAAATGYLRIAADRHYATDVLVGAAMGSLVGYAWPKLIHPQIRRDVSIAPSGRGLAVLGTF